MARAGLGARLRLGVAAYRNSSYLAVAACAVAEVKAAYLSPGKRMPRSTAT